jgi:steroid delta-isomerase-like uncharacterized protein
LKEQNMDEQHDIEAKIAMVHRAMAAISAGDLEALSATVTHDYVRDDLAQTFVADGADGLMAFVTTIRAALPDFTMEATDVFGSGDRVAAQLRLSGTHEGPFMGAPPTGRRVAINGISLFTFRDGRIHVNTQLIDAGGLIRQLTSQPELTSA